MGPIDRAYAALGASLAGVLVGSGLLESVAGLQIDPAHVLEETGEIDGVVRWAALVKLGTQAVRTIMGGPAARYVVEREARLELAVAGPAKDWCADVWAAALPAIAALPTADPTLGATAERFRISGLEDDDFPPNGAKALITFVLRVRSGDQLGLTD